MASQIFSKVSLAMGSPWIQTGFMSLLILLLLACYLGKASKSHIKDITVPYSLPVLKSTIDFVFDGLKFLERARELLPQCPTIRVALVQDDVYLIKSPKAIAEVFHNPNYTVTRGYSLVLSQCFGMRPRAVNAYVADTSGAKHKPIPGSKPRPNDRISFMTHENLTTGLLTDGFHPKSERFRRYFAESLQTVGVRNEWTCFPDLSVFFEKCLGSALIHTLFGRGLLDVDSNFVQDLWEYDKGVMGLAKRMPWFVVPRTHRLRDKLLAVVKAWQEKAARGSGDSGGVPGDVDEDMNWGCEMMRERFYMLLSAAGQDKDSVASTNLAFIWASVTNVVPSSMALAFHIFNSGPLLSSLRASLDSLPESLTSKDLDSVPLLLSMYAETLRWGVQIFIPRSAPFHDIKVGGVTIPRNKLTLINTYLVHTDERVWDSKHGKRALDQFWAQRFLLDPSDDRSGPRKETARLNEHPTTHQSQVFSSEGLEGAWIPYGGGQHACPGRLLAKRIMLLSAALLVRDFDVEILGDSSVVTFGSPRFGFGVKRPVSPIRFRIRSRLRR